MLQVDLLHFHKFYGTVFLYRLPIKILDSALVQPITRLVINILP